MATSRMLVTPRLQQRNNQRVLAATALLLAVILLPLAAEATVVKLTVVPDPATAGEVVTLTATVSQLGDPVPFGMVSFLSGKQVLGTAQITGITGTAKLKTRFGPGTYELTAKYIGNRFFPGNQSGPQPLTVNGTEPTITMVQAAVDGGNYDFTVAMFGYGFLAPTGMANLTVLSNGFNLGNIGLAGPGMSTFLPQQAYPTGNNPYGVASGDFNGDGILDLAVVNVSDNTVSVLLGNGDGTFQKQTTYATGIQPYAVAIGDFNGDGIADLAVTNPGAINTISVLLGIGDGTFQPQVTYTVLNNPTDIVVADFNGDGIADLAVANNGSSKVSVLLGNGDGTFQPQKTYPVGVQPVGVAVGDFNGDGIADLAVANQSDNTVSLLLGNGDGTFQPQKTYPVGVQPAGVAAGDFNGDGCLDLAIANFNDSTVSVLLGHLTSGECDGTFAAQTTYPTGTSPQGIAVADFNGDGVLDLAVTNSGGNTVGVLLGKGDGTFQPQQTYSVGMQPWGVAVGDFNGDSVPDAAAANNNASSVSILLGGTVNAGQLKNVFVPGSGEQQIQAAYTPNTDFYTGSQGSVMVTGSLIPTTTALAVTANGKPIPPGGGAVSGETIVLNATVTPGTYGTLQAGGTVSFLDVDQTLATVPITISAGNGVASFSPTLGLGSHYLSANYSGDNNFGSSFSIFGNFTIVGAYSVSLAVSPLLANPSTVVTMTATVTYSQGSGGTVTFFDGKQALGTVQVEGGSGSSPGTATLKSRFAPGTRSLQAVFNGLGQIGGSGAQSSVQMLTVTGTEPSITTLTEQPDGSNFDFTGTVFGFGFPAPPTGLLNFNDLTNGFFIATVPLAGPGMSTFLPQQTYLVGNEPLGVAVGDFNKDGFADLAITNFPDNTISVLLGIGDGTFQSQQIYQTGVEPAFIAVSDFNGDGIPDLAVTNFGDNTVGILLGKGDGTFQPQQTFPVGLGPVGVAVGDFNGDGLADLAVANDNDNTVSVLLGKGDGTFGAAQTFQVGQLPYGLAVADFNGDGFSDIVVANFVDNTVSVLLGKGDGTFLSQQPYPVGQNPYWVAAGDLNQDGIPDLAVANGTAGTVSVLLGKGDGSFQPQQAYPVGTTPTSVAIADFNGDGIPDVAAANVGDSTVSVLLGAGKGVLQPQRTYLTGVGPYAVAAADFNGDGVPDLAAPNAGDVTVSVLLGGTTITTQLNDVPIIGSGQHMIQSSYVPDKSSIYAASASNTVTVPAGGKAPTSTSLFASPPEGNLGNNVYLTATVTSPGGGTPTGTVSYFDTGAACSTSPPPPPVLIGMWPLTPNPTGQGSVADYSNNTLVAGQHCVTAIYNGDSNYNSSAPSNAVLVTVDGPFMLLPTSTMGTVPPGGMVTTSAYTDAVYSENIYSAVTCEPQQGTTACSVTCPWTTPAPCTLRSDSDEIIVTINASSGIGRLIPPLHRREHHLVATVMGLGGMGLVGLVLAPVRLRRKATAGVLLLVIVVLCFGTSCGGSFAPGISSAPVNNTFTTTVKATLCQQLSGMQGGCKVLGLQQFVYTLVIK